MPYILFFVLLVVSSAVCADESLRIDQLRWLEGCWDGQSSARQSEECWSEPAGGMMIGYGRTTSAAGRTGFEYLRLIEREGALVYVAQPGGGSPTEFAAVLVTDGLVRFSNPDHDYPRVIEYQRDGDLLTASIGDGETIEGSESVNRFRFILRDE